MSEEKNFLERWLRKKSEAQADAPQEPERPDVADAAPAEAAPDDAGAAPRPATAASGMTPQALEFDLASLPSIESITATTDVRIFMQPGVPQALTRAALRRAWAADPAIRDFRGLQENDWDFNDPDSIPGFGTFKPGEDISKLVARVFGEAEDEPPAVAAEEATAPEPQPHPAVAAEETAAVPAGDAPLPEAVPAPEVSAAPAADDLVQRNINIASQDSSSTVEPQSSQSRRSHGGALPK